MCPESPTPKQKLASVLKFAWYVCASILILSLPTFSYLQPRPAQSPGVRADQASRVGGPPREDAPVQTSESLLTSLVRNAVSAVAGGSDQSAATGRRPDTNESEDEAEDAPTRASELPPTQVRGTERISPQLFERRRVTRETFTRGPAEDSGLGQVQEGLEDLQQGYEQAFNTLFPDVFLGARAPANPFQGALEENGNNNGTGGDSTDTGADTGGGTTGGEDTAGGDSGEQPPPDPGQEEPIPPDPAPPGDSGGGGGSEPSEPPQTEDPFGFLVVGKLPGNVSDALVSRARIDNAGDFVLENSYRFSFFPGILHSILTFGENEKLLISDLDKDGNLDFIVVTEVPAVGTAIESYLQKYPGEFQLDASAFLYLQAIRSLTLFDFNTDGVDELAMVLSGSDNLFVFEHAGSEWRYSRELALSISPALVMSAAVAPGVKSRQLYVIDNSLQYVLTASDRQPDFFRPGSRAPLNRLRILEANLTGRETAPSLSFVFSLADQVVLAEGVGQNLHMFGSFQTNPNTPLLIIGDYARAGSRQMLWVP